MPDLLPPPKSNTGYLFFLVGGHLIFCFVSSVLYPFPSLPLFLRSSDSTTLYSNCSVTSTAIPRSFKTYKHINHTSKHPRCPPQHQHQPLPPRQQAPTRHPSPPFFPPPAAPTITPLPPPPTQQHPHLHPPSHTPPRPCAKSQKPAPPLRHPCTISAPPSTTP